LERDDEDFFQAEGIGERLQDKDEAGGGAIGIGDEEASVVAAIFLLDGNGIEMGCIDLGNEQRNIGVHAVIARIADDGIAARAKSSSAEPATEASSAENTKSQSREGSRPLTTRLRADSGWACRDAS